jgi:NADH-quinone oxidoreductase subunit M
LILATLIFGIYPSLIIDIIGPSVESLIQNIEASQSMKLVQN